MVVAAYEESRKKRLEENKKRMEELNLNKLSQALHTPKPSPVIPTFHFSFFDHLNAFIYHQQDFSCCLFFSFSLIVCTFSDEEGKAEGPETAAGPLCCPTI